MDKTEDVKDVNIEMDGHGSDDLLFTISGTGEDKPDHDVNMNNVNEDDGYEWNVDNIQYTNTRRGGVLYR